MLPPVRIGIGKRFQHREERQKRYGASEFGDENPAEAKNDMYSHNSPYPRA
jgi:hypothetical protein